MTGVEEPRFVSLQEVLYLHNESLSRLGGLSGIRDLGLVESALASALNTFLYGGGDLFGVAAAYAFHLEESQAFIDGNKRTGVATAIMFLKINKVEIPQDDGTLYNAMIQLAKKRMGKAGLADVFRRMSSQQ